MLSLVLLVLVIFIIWGCLSFYSVYNEVKVQKSKKIRLIDVKLEFGKTKDGKVVLADEISPDTCRLWDMATNEKLDRDRFRRDLGGVEDAYYKVYDRLLG